MIKVGSPYRIEEIILTPLSSSDKHRHHEHRAVADHFDQIDLESFKGGAGPLQDWVHIRMDQAGDYCCADL